MVESKQLGFDRFLQGFLACCHAVAGQNILYW